MSFTKLYNIIFNLGPTISILPLSENYSKKSLRGHYDVGCPIPSHPEKTEPIHLSWAYSKIEDKKMRFDQFCKALKLLDDFYNSGDVDIPAFKSMNIFGQLMFYNLANYNHGIEEIIEKTKSYINEINDDIPTATQLDSEILKLYVLPIIGDVHGYDESKELVPMPDMEP